MLFAGKIYAQDGRLFFHTLGITTLAGATAPPSQNIQTVVNIYQRPQPGQEPVFLRTEVINRKYSDLGFMAFGFTYGLRWNMVELNRHNAISLSTAPSFGFTIFEESKRLGDFAVPFYLDYNWGRKATIDSDKTTGWHLGAGWQFTATGFITYQPRNTLLTGYGPHFWGMPAVRCGMRTKNAFFDLYLSAIRVETTNGGFTSEADLAGEFGADTKFSNYVPIDLPMNSTFEDIYDRRKDMQEKVYSAFYFKLVIGVTVHDGRAKKRRVIREKKKTLYENYALR
ncbi:MAG: hypothetical protein MUC87_11695 [Bacteroidia bacterium]|jgi:hypothetical protein|nr:hypothetical protein [Bacteroidia bacterium]